MTYQPKGGMCASCMHSSRDCSTLPFKQYPVIERYALKGNSINIVKCGEFKRNESQVTL